MPKNRSKFLLTPGIETTIVGMRARTFNRVIFKHLLSMKNIVKALNNTATFILTQWTLDLN